MLYSQLYVVYLDLRMLEMKSDSETNMILQKICIKFDEGPGASVIS